MESQRDSFVYQEGCKRCENREALASDEMCDRCLSQHPRVFISMRRCTLKCGDLTKFFAQAANESALNGKSIARACNQYHSEWVWIVP